MNGCGVVFPFKCAWQSHNVQTEGRTGLSSPLSIRLLTAFVRSSFSCENMEVKDSAHHSASKSVLCVLRGARWQGRVMFHLSQARTCSCFKGNTELIVPSSTVSSHRCAHVSSWISTYPLIHWGGPVLATARVFYTNSHTEHLCRLIRCHAYDSTDWSLKELEKELLLKFYLGKYEYEKIIGFFCF